MLKVKKGIKKLVEEAEALVESLTPAEVEEKLKKDGVTLIDLRDIPVSYTHLTLPTKA